MYHQRAVLVCWLCLCLKIIFVESDGLLVVEPSSVLIPVGNDSIFECSSIDNTTIEWRIDARGLTELTFFGQSIMSLNNFGFMKIVTNETNSSKVKVDGVSMNNNTKLRCRAFHVHADGTQEIETSQSAELQFYVSPDPPNNIQLKVHSQLLLLSWSPPFAVAPYTYTLIILNGDSSETITNISSNVTNYIYNGGSTDVCQNVSFYLQSVNDAGVGEMSTITTATIPNVPDQISLVTTSVVLNESNVPRLLINIKAPSTCEDYPVLSYSILLTDITTDNDTTSNSTINTTDITINGNMVQLIIEEGIEQDRVYNVTVETNNEVGASTSSEAVEFRTTDVQQMLVSYNPGSSIITVRCTFLTGSTAKGCHVTVSIMDNEIFNKTIYRDGTKRVITKQIDEPILAYVDITSLLVLGYDYEADNTIGDVPIIADIIILPINTVSTQTPSVLVVTTTTDQSASTTSTPIPSDILNLNGSLQVSSAIIITVSVATGLIILAVLITVVIIIMQRRSKKNGQTNSDESGGGAVEDTQVVDFVQTKNGIDRFTVATDRNYYTASDETLDSSVIGSIDKNHSSSVNGSIGHLRVSVEPYGITILHPMAVRPQEHLYQTVHECRKVPLGQQNSTAPLLTQSSSSSESSHSPPPLLPFHTHPTARSPSLSFNSHNTTKSPSSLDHSRTLPSHHSSSLSPEPLYHVLEQNSSQCSNGSGSPGSGLPLPPLYDQVTPERPPTASSYSSSVCTPLHISSNASTPTPKKEHIYHTLEPDQSGDGNEPEANEKEWFTVSQSTCNSQLGILDSQTTISTVCSVRDNFNEVFDDTDGIPPHFIPHNYQRQYTVDQAKLKSRSLPIGARLGARGRCNSEPDNRVLGIEPYNTLEKHIKGSYTLKRTLV